MTWEQEIEEAKQYAREEAREEGLREGREEGRKEGREEGRAEGLSQGRIETAKNLLDMQMLPEQIAKATGLPLEQVLALQKKICVPLKNC